MSVIREGHVGKVLNSSVTHVMKPVLVGRLFFYWMTFGKNSGKTVTHVLYWARLNDRIEDVDSSISRVNLRIPSFGG
jgi:hypothetical protein